MSGVRVIQRGRASTIQKKEDQKNPNAAVIPEQISERDAAASWEMAVKGMFAKAGMEAS